VSGSEREYIAQSYSPSTETEYAQARVAGRLYTSKTFPNPNPSSADHGQPSRFVYQVFDDNGIASSLKREGEEWIVTPIEGSRSQIKVLISRESGSLVDLWVQRVPAAGSTAVVKEVLRVRRADAIRLAEFFRRLMLIEPDGADTGVRLDEETVATLLNNPESARRMYEEQGPALRALIAGDEHARDVVALAGRRASLNLFRKMLDDEDFFDSLVEPNKGKEAVWQAFFEANPWVLGVGLGSQLFTSWSEEKLEQIVRGHSVASEGKRADALLRTSGVIQSMVFAEIKHHRTDLLKTEYRPGVWSMSKDLSGGISQAQITVHQAATEIGDRITAKDAAGYETADLTYLMRPRSFLIIGNLSEFVNEDGRHHPQKIRSFELARRHLQEPEVVTFDELLARAEWIVENAA
jgi:hypothetical protein